MKIQTNFRKKKPFPNKMIVVTNHGQLYSLLKWLKIVVECHDIKVNHRFLTSFELALIGHLYLSINTYIYFFPFDSFNSNISPFFSTRKKSFWLFADGGENMCRLKKKKTKTHWVHTPKLRLRAYHQITVTQKWKIGLYGRSTVQSVMFMWITNVLTLYTCEL